jgi:hypothetical protein
MDRIDQQQFPKKPIPAASEAGRDSASSSAHSETACHWLSSAMAIWIKQEESAPSLLVESDHAHSAS